MRYTGHFFELDGEKFARRLRDETDTVIERTRKWFLRQDGLDEEFTEQDLEYGLDLARRICRGELPSACGEDEFWAFLWLADTELERIPFNPLIGVKGFGLFEDVGLWPLLAQWGSPFSIPRCEDAPPAAGFVPCVEISRAAIPSLESLPVTDEDSRFIRQQLVEILETLDEENLDFLFVIV